MTVPAPTREQSPLAEEQNAPDGRFGYATVGAPPPYRDPGERPADEERSGRRWPRILAMVLVALLLLAAALLGGRAWGAAGQVEVWQLTRDVAAGETLRAGDVQTVKVASAAATGAVPAERRLAGRVTVAPLPAGTVLRPDQFATGGVVPGPGEALVGVAASAGLAPDDLRPGDSVTVLELPADTQGVPERPKAEEADAFTVLVSDAIVQRVAGGGAQGSLVTLVVRANRAAEVATLSAQNRVALVGSGS